MHHKLPGTSSPDGGRLNMRSTLWTLFLCAGLACAAAAQSSDEAACSGDDPDKIIAGCTAVLHARGETKEVLSRALNARGLAYDQKHEPDRALVDYNQAIQLDPKNAQPFNNRGVTYTFRG